MTENTGSINPTPLIPTTHSNIRKGGEEGLGFLGKLKVFHLKSHGKTVELTPEGWDKARPLMQRLALINEQQATRVIRQGSSFVRWELTPESEPVPRLVHKGGVVNSPAQETKGILLDLEKIVKTYDVSKQKFDMYAGISRRRGGESIEIKRESLSTTTPLLSNSSLQQSVGSEKVNELTSRLERLQNANQQLDQNNQQLLEENRRLKSNLELQDQQKREEVNIIQREQQLSQQRIKELEEQLQKEKNGVELLKLQQQNTSKQLEETRKNIQILESTKNENEENLSEQTRKSEKAEKELQALHERHDLLENKFQSQTGDFEKSQLELKNRQEQVEQLNQTLEQVKKEYENLELQLKPLQIELSKLEQSLQEVGEGKHVAERQINDLKHQLQQKHHAIEEVTKNLEVLRESQKLKEKTVEEQKKTLETLSEQVQNGQEELKIQEEQHRLLLINIKKEGQEKINQMTKELQQAQKSVDLSTKELQEKANEIKNLQISLEESKKLQEEMMISQLRLESEKDLLSKELNKKTSSSQQEIVLLTQQLKILEGKNQELETQLRLQGENEQFLESQLKLINENSTSILEKQKNKENEIKNIALELNNASDQLISTEENKKILNDELMTLKYKDLSNPAALDRNIDQLLEDMKKELSVREELFDELYDVNKKILNDNGILRDSVISMKNENEQLKQKQSILEWKNNVLEGSYKSLKNEHDSIVKEHNQTEKYNKELITENTNRFDEIQAQNNKISELKELILIRSNKNKKLSEELKNEKEKKDVLSNDKKLMKIELETRWMEINNKNQEIIQLKDDQMQYNLEIEKMRETNLDLRKRLEESDAIKENYLILENQVNDLRKERLILLEEKGYEIVLELEDTLEKAGLYGSQLMKENQYLKERIDILTEENEKLKKEEDN
ncbi:MAG: hypothetical protein JSR80_08370 [Verrucomicrobia bacterium]|nr:hypothetical protein [Verrucomicrobiota bacterium]